MSALLIQHNVVMNMHIKYLFIQPLRFTLVVDVNDKL